MSRSINFDSLDDSPEKKGPREQWQFTIPKKFADRVESLGGNREAALTIIESACVAALGNYLHRLNRERKNGSD